MCGTCKYCLGFFQIAAVGSGGLMTTVVSIYYLYGGMVPTFAFAIGFWIEYGVGWLSIYLTFYIVRVLGKGLFTSWTPKFCFVLIIVIIILYISASVCFFVPVTAERMKIYSHFYNKTYKRIPTFLFKFQEQYQCCGIYSYKDYNNPQIFGHEREYSRRVSTVRDPQNNNVLLSEEEVKKLHGEKGTQLIHSTRIQHYFDIPHSCCKHENRIKVKNCGRYLEYTKALEDKAKKGLTNETIHHPDAFQRVNNVSVGCFDKYQIIMENSIFQLNWLLGVLRWGSLVQALVYFSLIWVYRLSLRAMKRTVRRQYEELDDDDNPVMITVGGKKRSIQVGRGVTHDNPTQGFVGIASLPNKKSIADFTLRKSLLRKSRKSLGTKKSLSANSVSKKDSKLESKS